MWKILPQFVIAVIQWLSKNTIDSLVSLALLIYQAIYYIRWGLCTFKISKEKVDNKNMKKYA